MSETIFETSRPIAREMLSDMHESEAGNPMLQVRAYYYKDARRGLKLSVSRVLATEWGFSYDLMNRHNGLIHLADMPRKPTPKVAAQWAERIAASLDKVQEIALASRFHDEQELQRHSSHSTGETTDA